MEDNAPGRVSPELEDPCFPYTVEQGTMLNSMKTVEKSATEYTQAQIKDWQRTDPRLTAIINYKQTEILPEDQKEARKVILMSLDYELVEGILYQTKAAKTKRPKEVIPPLKLAVPQAMEQSLIEQYHEGLSGGHQSTQRMYENMRDKYYVPNLFQKCDEVRRACKFCQKTKLTVKPRDYIKPRPIPERPFECITADFLGPIHKTYTGKQYVLVIVCELTKYVILRGVTSPDAVQTAQIIYKDVIAVFGMPRQLFTDQGAAFTSSLITGLCRMLQIEQKFAPVGHHQSTGLVERNIQTVSTILAPLVQEMQESWEDVLPSLQMVMNYTPNSTTQLSPYLCVFGRLPYQPAENEIEAFNLDQVKGEAKEYLTRIRQQLQIVLQLQRQRLMSYHDRIRDPEIEEQKQLYYEKGAQVYAKNINKTRKSDDPWVGPLEIKEYEGTNVVKLDWPSGSKRYPTKLTSLEDVKPAFTKTKEVRRAPEERKQVELQDEVGTSRKLRERTTLKKPEYYGEPVTTLTNQQAQRLFGYSSKSRDRNQYYKVKRVLGKCPTINNEMQYLVQFVGYDPSEAIWLDEDKLNEKALEEGRMAPFVQKDREESEDIDD